MKILLSASGLALITLCAFPPALAVANAFGVTASASQDEDNLEAALATLKKHRDDTPEDILEVLRLDGTEAALDGMIEVYDTLETTYMQIALIQVIATYDGLSGANAKAVDFIAKAAANNTDGDVREAATLALSWCPSAGPLALRTLVDTPIPTQERERALEYYIEMAPSNDLEFLKSIYVLPHMMDRAEAAADKKDKKKKKKRGKDKAGDEDDGPKVLRNTMNMRRMAIEAIWSRLDEEELMRYFQKENAVEAKEVLLRALDDKKAKGIEERIEKILTSAGRHPRLRVASAKLYGERKGIEALAVFMDVAKQKGTTSNALYDMMASIITTWPAEEVSPVLAKRLSRAKNAELAFLMNAMPLPCEPKVFKKLVKGLKSKHAHERVGAIRFVTRVGGEDAIKRLTKALKGEKDMHVTGALLEGLSTMQPDSEEWTATLKEYSEDKNEDMRHAARMEILRLARPSDFETFVEWLQDPSWSIRHGALLALEGIREHRVLEPLIERMASEKGRLSYEFGESLFRLTGEDFGKRANAWAGWYEKEGADAHILTDAELTEAKRQRVLKAQKERSRIARFFDISIESTSVIFVVDVSGSMTEMMEGLYVNVRSESRMERAKKELVKAIDTLQEGTRFNVISFSGGIGSWWDEPLSKMDEPDREDAKAWVEKLGAGGGTNLYEGVLEAMSDPDADTIIVLSDGIPSVGDLTDPGDIREDIAARNAERNIVIHTIALGGALEVLEWLAEDSGGNFVQYE